MLAVQGCGFFCLERTQEQNLTIKDIYGQEVVDAFFKNEAAYFGIVLRPNL